MWNSKDNNNPFDIDDNNLTCLELGYCVNELKGIPCPYCSNKISSNSTSLMQPNFFKCMEYGYCINEVKGLPCPGCKLRKNNR